MSEATIPLYPENWHVQVRSGGQEQCLRKGTGRELDD